MTNIFKEAADQAVMQYLSEAPKVPEGITNFAKDMKGEKGRNPKIYLATFDGKPIKAQNTDQIFFDDDVPMTKYFSRGGYKTWKPAVGELHIIETDTFWYAFDSIPREWYAINRSHYKDRPPFDY